MNRTEGIARQEIPEEDIFCRASFFLGISQTTVRSMQRILGGRTSGSITVYEVAMQHFSSNSSLSVYFLKGSKRYFALSILFALTASLMDLLSPRIVGLAIDLLSSAGKERGGRLYEGFLRFLYQHFGDRTYLASHLYLLAGLVFATAVLGAVFRYLYRLCNAYGAERLVERMRNTLFSHIEHLRYGWYMENDTGDIIQRCTSDVETVKNFLSDQLTSVFRIVVLILISLFFMFGIHPGLTSVALVFVPLIFLYSFLFHRKIAASFLVADEEEGRLSTIAQENLTGVRVVRAFGREEKERERFSDQNKIYTDAYMRFSVLISAFWSVGEFISGLQVMLVVAIGAYFTAQSQLSAGDYVAFISYNAMLVWPVRNLGRVISDMSKAGVSVERIRYIMNAEEEQDTEEALSPEMDREIEFQHVSFRYAPELPEVLSDVSFRIPYGTSFGILGGTGSGKSTLMYLLLRLYPLKDGQGKITIGGVDLRDIRGEYLREHVGMVLQEPYLFSRTLKENIRIARAGAGEQELRRVSDMAALTDAVARFRDGYETMVGERGVTLSGGQKQRTAIAQLLIRKTEIMVFDDSLSAVDTETEARIRAALAEEAGKSTRILISHRIATLMQAEQILVLNHGRVEAIGSHEELLMKSESYRKICEIQGVTDRGGRMPEGLPDDKETMLWKEKADDTEAE